MLREEAYVAARLKRQLEEQAGAFSRPQPQPLSRGPLEVSKIFDWFKETSSRPAYFARYLRGSAIRRECRFRSWTTMVAERLSIVIRR